MFRNTFGYDSWDGNGGKMITVNNDPRIDCPNANWNGVTTNYCSGVTGDDTVAHEWAPRLHRVDLGPDLPVAGRGDERGLLRHLGRDRRHAQHPPERGRRTRSGTTVYRTAGSVLGVHTRADRHDDHGTRVVAGPCVNVPASFGPVITQAGVDATAIVGTDAAETLEDGAPGTTTDGCSPFNNAGAINGQWVYVDRGTCTLRRQDRQRGGCWRRRASSSATRPPARWDPIAGDSEIYGVMVIQRGRREVQDRRRPGLRSTSRPGPADTDDTTVGSPASPTPPSAARSATCGTRTATATRARSPTRSTTAGPSDSGGVHSNSGVVNRTFAILVDGIDGSGSSASGSTRRRGCSGTPRRTT